MLVLMIFLISCSWGQLQMWGWFLALSIPGGFITVMFSLGKEATPMLLQWRCVGSRCSAVQQICAKLTP